MGMLQITSKIEFQNNGFTASLSDGFQLQVDLLEEWLLRIAIVPDTGLDIDRTWMIAPKGDVLWRGRDRLSCDGFSCPAVAAKPFGIQGGQLAICIEEKPLRLTALQKKDDIWHTLFEDRKGGAYQWFEKSHRLRHFQHFEDDQAHYGLGDKTGPLDRTGRRLRCLQSDALGYNAETSDPLYKHAPWLIVSNQKDSYGLLYDTMAETTFDLGAEHSNYFERFRQVETSEKGMVLYAMAGPKVRDIVPRLHRLTGHVAFPPRWSMGFAFTTMHHADAPDAQKVILDFANQARSRNLPISAIHLGSGYTAGSDGLRYVFNWNTSRFPDRAEFFSELRAMGYHTCANIKPVLLTGHKAFGKARENGWFVRKADGEAAIEMFWGGEGASLDFTNHDTIKWWQRGVSDQVLGAGFDATWNDNNECELWDETAILSGFNEPLSAMQCRPVHALLMTRASYEATLVQEPEKRPYTISRAGPIGIARYGETWSGDNKTSWRTLKWNLRQGLSMSLSGFPLVGHDIGGFDGPPPDEELLVRWFQMMALHPRCVMNSWKVDYHNIPNLPWMHADVFPHIQTALELRYRFLPVLYGLVRQAHLTGHPVIAPTLYHFDDPACREDCDTFMLGEDILVAPIVTPGAKSVQVYLPKSNFRWIDYHSGEAFEGGQCIARPVTLGQLPLFIHEGSILPLAAGWDEKAPHDPSEICLTVFENPEVMETGKLAGQFYWDDGVSRSAPNDPASIISYEITLSDKGKTDLKFDRDTPKKWPLLTASVNQIE